MFLKNMGNLSPSEQILYNHWLIMLQLLEMGLPWDAIEALTEGEIALVLAVQMAKLEKQQEDEAQQQRIMQNRR
mgnify:CR=1 FL=1|tara:strand:- start:3127 stop:3348 length:222 start_codon:yes stop_codon:yes gene_type:complete